MLENVIKRVESIENCNEELEKLKTMLEFT